LKCQLTAENTVFNPFSPFYLKKQPLRIKFFLISCYFKDFAGRSYHLFPIVLMCDNAQQGTHLPQILPIKQALVQHPTIPYYIYCGPQALGKFSSIFPMYLHIFYQIQVIHLSSSVSRKIDLVVDNRLNMNIIYAVYSTACCKYVVVVVIIMMIIKKLPIEANKEIRDSLLLVTLLQVICREEQWGHQCPPACTCHESHFSELPCYQFLQDGTFSNSDKPEVPPHFNNDVSNFLPIADHVNLIISSLMDILLAYFII